MANDSNLWRAAAQPRNRHGLCRGGEEMDHQTRNVTRNQQDRALGYVRDQRFPQGESQGEDSEARSKKVRNEPPKPESNRSQKPAARSENARGEAWELGKGAQPENGSEPAKPEPNRSRKPGARSPKPQLDLGKAGEAGEGRPAGRQK